MHTQVSQYFNFQQFATQTTVNKHLVSMVTGKLLLLTRELDYWVLLSAVKFQNLLLPCVLSIDQRILEVDNEGLQDFETLEITLVVPSLGHDNYFFPCYFPPMNVKEIMLDCAVLEMQSQSSG